MSAPLNTGAEIEKALRAAHDLDVAGRLCLVAWRLAAEQQQALDRQRAALAQIAETARWYADHNERDPHEVDHALCVEVVSLAERALEEPLANGGSK